MIERGSIQLVAATLPLAVFYVYALYRDAECMLPFYIGKGKGARWLVHERYHERDKNLHRRRIIEATIAAVGFLPKRKLATRLTEPEAFAMEVAEIARIGRVPNGPLVNLTDGGEGGSNPSEEVRRQRGNKRRGQKFTSEQRERLRAGIAKSSTHGKSFIGRQHSDETKQQIRSSRKGKGGDAISAWASQFWNTSEGKEIQGRRRRGIPHDAASLAKMSEGQQRFQASEAGAADRDQRSQKFTNTIWITDNQTSRRHPGSEPIPDGWRRGRVVSEAHREAARRSIAIAAKSRW